MVKRLQQCMQCNSNASKYTLENISLPLHVDSLLMVKLSLSFLDPSIKCYNLTVNI